MDDVNVEIDEGMTAICDFEIERWTIMEYFLEPVTDGIENSFKEK